MRLVRVRRFKRKFRPVDVQPRCFSYKPASKMERHHSGDGPDQLEDASVQFFDIYLIGRIVLVVKGVSMV